MSSPDGQRRIRNLPSREGATMTDDRTLPQIGAPATRALAAQGITRLADLTHHRSDDLLALHGVGPRAVRLLTAALAEQGMSFAEGDQPTR
jgi:predicted flap endonuclease-1-like 5' DNA nuclease